MNLPSVSAYLATLPFELLKWWYTQGLLNLVMILKFVFFSFMHLLSFKSLFRTFFQPWKNEYREGLVKTAIVVGIVMKSLLIFFDIFTLSFIGFFEAIILAIWLVLPISPIIFLYGIFA